MELKQSRVDLWVTNGPVMGRRNGSEDEIARPLELVMMMLLCLRLHPYFFCLMLNLDFD